MSDLNYPLHLKIPDNEFTNDIEYMPSMDLTWHYWMQDKYTVVRGECEKNYQLRLGYRTIPDAKS